MYLQILSRRLQQGPSRYRYGPDASECTHFARIAAGLGATIFSGLTIAGALAALGLVIIEPLSRLTWVV